MAPNGALEKVLAPICRKRAHVDREWRLGSLAASRGVALGGVVGSGCRGNLLMSVPSSLIEDYPSDLANSEIVIRGYLEIDRY